MANPIDFITSAVSEGPAKEIAEHVVPRLEQMGIKLEDHGAEALKTALKEVLDNYKIQWTFTVEAVKKG